MGVKKNRTLIFTVLEAGTSKFKALADTRADQDPLPVHRRLSSDCAPTHMKAERALRGLFLIAFIRAPSS